MPLQSVIVTLVFSDMHAWCLFVKKLHDAKAIDTSPRVDTVFFWNKEKGQVAHDP